MVLAPSAFTIDASKRPVTLVSAPAMGAAVTAELEFDTPVRFDLYRLILQMESFAVSRVTVCSLMEV